jgi:lipid-binding SYLF domain-containing protein
MASFLSRLIAKSIGVAVLSFAVVGMTAADEMKSVSSRESIDAHVREAVQDFYKTTSAGRELAGRAAGMLVFPNIVKAGIGVGGEYGEGALLVGGGNAGYYNIVSASIGFQLGVQAKSVVILFMTGESLTKFRESKGWKAGVDGSVAIAKFGVGEAIDTETAKKPIIGFVFNNKGLMYNLTLEGSKISKIDR